MQTPPVDPNVADIAPSGNALTSYDKEHLVTYICACSMRMRKVRTGARSHEWCCISIRNMNVIGSGRRSTAIYRAPNGWRSTVIVTYCVVAHRPKATLPFRH
jgi:hypothetical protein